MAPKRATGRRVAPPREQLSHSLFPIIDHVVILVPDLEKAIKTYSTQLGFRVIPGGKHAGFPGQRTWNALIAFEADKTYIELIAFMPKHIEEEENRKSGKVVNPQVTKPTKNHRWFGLNSGLIDFALLPKDIDTAIQTFSKLSPAVNYSGPAPGARKTPAGRELQWKMGYPPSLAPERNDPDADRPLPFFCFDVSPREWRVPLEESEERGGHTNGVVGLSSVTILAGISEAATVTAEQRASYKGPSFETVVQAYAGWCLPLGKDWRSVIEEEEVLAEISDEVEETLEHVESTAAGAQSSELIPQPENTVVVTHRVAKFYLQKEPPSFYHEKPQQIIIAEAVTQEEVTHVLANGSSTFEIELLADAGRMWGLENGSAGDEGELMPVDHACGARIRTRYVWGIQNGSSRL